MANQLYSTTESLSSWLTNIKADDIDGGLAANFDGSLSGLGVELGSSTYNMSEALLALPVFKQESTDAGFQYVLGAATSPATKLYEETLTYLNQGQSYEVKVKKLGDLGQLQGRYLKSIIRVIFHERRLQYNEKEQLNFWKQMRPGERIVDVDIPLSYGLIKVEINKNKLNCIEFVWDPSVDTGIFIKIHAIGTEFTPRKHGGEKGVPFRLQVETYLYDEYDTRLLHAGSCQVKVFKPKGADRKHKTDREKIEKRSESEKEKYQPSYVCTVLTEIPVDQIKTYLEQQEQENKAEEQDAASPTYSEKTTPVPSRLKYVRSQSTVSSPATPQTTAVVDTTPPSVFNTVSDLAFLLDQASCDSSSHQSTQTSATNTTDTPVEQLQVEPLSPRATAQQVSQWLHTHRFSSFTKVFQSFSGADLLRLSREDLIQICGVADGIRLNNALQSRTVRPKLTMYIFQARGINMPTADKQDQISPSNSNHGNTPKQQNSPDGDTGDVTPTPTSQDVKKAQVKSVSPTKEETHVNGSSSSSKQKADEGKAKKEASVESKTEVLAPPSGSATHDEAETAHTEHTSTASAVGKRSLSSVNSGGGHQGWKRQYREAEESDHEAELYYTKKQRTRTLELSRKGVYHAVYLEYLTLKHLKEKLAACFSISPTQIQEVHVMGPSGIHILVTDNVVQNFPDESRYNIEASEDDVMLGYYNILLQTTTNS